MNEALRNLSDALTDLMDVYNLRATELHGDREVNESTQDEVDDECGYVLDDVIEDLRKLRRYVDAEIERQAYNVAHHEPPAWRALTLAEEREWLAGHTSYPRVRMTIEGVEVQD